MTTPPWGAAPDDWTLLDLAMGLTPDLLPVVSNPLAVISSGSTMKALGKTPSRYNASREVVGIPDWTRKQATDAEVARWAREPDYGICIQTRHVRALDIDVPNIGLAGRILDTIAGPGGVMDEWGCPVRSRGNTGKFLLAFRLVGDFPKRVIKVREALRDINGAITEPAWNIEFLGNGQQFVAMGTHPSGTRYMWDWYERNDFPEISVTQFEAIWTKLVKEFACEEPTESAGPRKRGETLHLFDPVIEQLEILDEGRDGQLYITCPFSAGHSTDTGVAQTCYFPAGSGGYAQGHFKCLHASCASRTDGDFLDALGLREDLFEDTVGQDHPGGSSARQEENRMQHPGSPPAVGTPGSGEPLPHLERDGKGRPHPTVRNVHALLLRPDVTGFSLAHDAFTGGMVFRETGQEAWRPFRDADYTRLRHRLEGPEVGFLPVGRELMRDVVELVGEESSVDTAQLWLSRVPEWDNVSRIPTFLYRYLGAEDSAYTRAVGAYLWSAMVGRILTPGVKADMVPIIVGDQGRGKSSFVRALAPWGDAFTEISFSDSEDNLARQLKGKVVAEIGELRGLHSRELESIKAFVSRNVEEWIPKYREFTVRYPRRCVFVGTTNEEQFLADTTGNRRWLPVKVGGVPVLADALERELGVCALGALARDKAMLWAEARSKYLVEGVAHVEAARLAAGVHAEYMVRDPWSDVVATWLGQTELDGGQAREAGCLRLTEVLSMAIGVPAERIRVSDERRMAAVLKGLGFDHGRLYVDGQRQRVWTRTEGGPGSREPGGGDEGRVEAGGRVLN